MCSKNERDIAFNGAEGFFGFFFDLGAKKKRPAGEAIKK
jgi:hypothetical protein